MDTKRRLWGMVLLTSGTFGLLAVGLMLTPVNAAPLAAVSWPLAVYSGYRVWKAAHPATSVWRELGRRGLAVAGFMATLLAFLAVQVYPQVVAAIVGVWLAAIVLLFVGLALAGRESKP